jgi:hypothetical protein
MLYSPSCESLWDADCVRDWKRHFLWQSEPPKALPLSGLLSNLISSTLATGHLSRFTLLLCNYLLELAFLGLTPGSPELDLNHWEEKGLTSRDKLFKVLTQLKIAASNC